MQFNFENAFAHFAKTGAPRGFVWKYALTYVALSIAMFVLMMLLMGGFYGTLFAAMGSQDPDALLAATQMSGGMIALIYLIVLPLSLLFYAVFEASYLRRYMRQDKFFLRLGGDEWRVFVVLLIWFLVFLVAMIVIGLVVGILMAVVGVATDGSTGGMVMMVGLVYLLPLIFMATLGVRFSPAAAMTIRDRRIRFLSAWSATKGKFWTLLGAYAAWFVLGIVAYFVVVLLLVLMMMPMFASFAAMETGAEPSGPAFGITAILGIVFYLLLLAAGACFYYIWAGPAALAAKVQGQQGDPNEQRVALDM